MDAPSIVAPAPWQLAGQGLIVAVRVPREERQRFLPDDVVLASDAGLSFLMFVDYTSSAVGPYHELLFIPGIARIGDQRRRTISRIFVSSEASVENGRRNWGIPKDRCDFDVAYDADGGGRAALALEGASPFAELEFEARGPRWPFPGGLAPAALRTLAQAWEGRQFTYAPSASGHARFARVRHWRFDPAQFPDLAKGRVVAAMRITDFRMTFPVARIEPLQAAAPRIAAA